MRGPLQTWKVIGYWLFNQSIIFKTDTASWASQRMPVGHTILRPSENTSDAGFSRWMCEIVAIHLHCEIRKAWGAVYLSGLLAAGTDRPTLGIYAVLSFSLPSYSCIFTWIYPSSMPACFGANNMGAWTGLISIFQEGRLKIINE